ncbi:putative permease [Clostridium sp. M62/1]|nr:putative permease [Clostridium sp. M62/1]
MEREIRYTVKAVLRKRKNSKEKMRMSEKETKGAEYDFYGKLPLRKAIPLGLQHVLAMFVGNLTPLLIITGACGLANTQEFAGLQVDLLQNAMLVAGIVTLVQLYAIGPVGGKVPIIMGTSSGFIGVFNSVVGVMGGGILSYGAIMMASILGGIFEGILGFFLKPLRRFFPALVTGTVVLSIGLSLIAVGVNSFGGGDKAPDFGSLENLFLGTLVLVVIIVLKHGTKGMTSSSSILIGIIVGYVASAIMGLMLPTVGVTAEGVEYTKAWVLNWDKVAEAGWVSIPRLMPVKPVFDWRAVIPVMIMFIVTAVETVGDISGVTEGGMGREATDTELSGGIICDGLGSAFAALFGVLPNTSFSQNVGLVTMTKIVNRFALATGAVFLILCGLLPKLAALISIMPQSVLGGAAVMMFSSIVMSGIQLITKKPLTPRSITIVSVALGLGYGIGANSGVLSHLPQGVQLIFGGSGIVPAALVAILLNVLLPNEKGEAETQTDRK